MADKLAAMLNIGKFINVFLTTVTAGANCLQFVQFSIILSLDTTTTTNKGLSHHKIVLVMLSIPRFSFFT